MKKDNRSYGDLERALNPHLRSHTAVARHTERVVGIAHALGTTPTADGPILQSERNLTMGTKVL